MSENSYNLGPLQDLVGYHFRRTSSLIRKDFEQATDGLGIRQVSFGVLSVISANPGIRQGEVGAMLDIQRANMVAMISELSEDGLVARGRDPRDKRAVTLTLTEKGQAQLAKAIERIAAHEASMMRSLSQRERDQLLDMLQRISHNCEG